MSTDMPTKFSTRPYANLTPFRRLQDSIGDFFERLSFQLIRGKRMLCFNGKTSFVCVASKT